MRIWRVLSSDPEAEVVDAGVVGHHGQVLARRDRAAPRSDSPAGRTAPKPPDMTIMPSRAIPSRALRASGYTLRPVGKLIGFHPLCFATRALHSLKEASSNSAAFRPNYRNLDILARLNATQPWQFAQGTLQCLLRGSYRAASGPPAPGRPGFRCDLGRCRRALRTPACLDHPAPRAGSPSAPAHSP